jgi:nucleoside 2-deoxyribosyltransferase
MKVYLAGPLFSTAEREFNARIAEVLCRAGHDVWLPQEAEDRALTGAALFRADAAGIDRADVVVADMDGPDPDSGTCWECGYACGEKPIVLFRTDFRTADDPEKAPYNFMLTESATRTLFLAFADSGRVGEAILETLAALEATDGAGLRAPRRGGRLVADSASAARLAARTRRARRSAASARQRPASPGDRGSEQQA